jgi:formylglycine-generating enzyme required for sulfatase activity/energy-coupling factor transporter ATP-binding protein EcfA2
MDKPSSHLSAPVNLQALGQQIGSVIPGTLYGRLAAALLSPVLTALAAHDFAPLVTLFGQLGGVGGNLIANQVESWQGLSESELAIDLTAKVASDPLWRTTLDQLLQQASAVETVAARLVGAERERFFTLLEQEVARLESSLTVRPVVDQPANSSTGAVTVSGDVRESVINIGGAVTQHFYGQEKPGPDPATLRTAYLNRLFSHANTLSLAGVDPKTASDEAEARLNLGAIYTALLTTAPETGELLTPGQASDLHERQLSAVAQLNQQRRLVLLGDPGSGKSTFVNFVTLCLAGESLGHSQVNLRLLTAPLPDDMAADDPTSELPPQPWVHGPLLPVRIILRDFAARGLPADGTPATANHLWRFIAGELEAAALGEYAPHLHKELMNQGGLILFDGLDEVPDAEHQRTQIKQVVEDFADTFLRCRILVTSRTYAYQHQEWRLNNFAAAVLAPFTSAQIVAFVDRWYAHIGELRHLRPEDAQGRAALLKGAIFASDRLRALAERPLLLTLTASLHAWRGGSLPDRREELYADAVDLLLEWWESQRITRDAHGRTTLAQPSLTEWLRVDRSKVRALLNEVAFEAHATQPTLVGTADIPESTLVTRLLYINENEDVKPRLLVAYLSQRAGLLLPRGVKNYTFPHRTFQEYLAACYLTDIDYPDLVAELTRQDPNRWREVTLLAGAKAARGTSSALWQLVDALCFREPEDPAFTVADEWGAHLAGQTLIEAANLNQISPRHRPKVERVARSLTHVLTGRTLPPTERAQAGRTLARLGETRRSVVSVDEMIFCLAPAGAFAWGDEGDRCEIPYDFWIARFPVTNAQFRLFVAASGYQEERFWPEAARVDFWSGRGFQGRYDSRPRNEPRTFDEPFSLANHPVVGISWYEALAFTRWLAEYLQQRSLLPTGWTVRLPSEQEWEKAARGGELIATKPVMAPLHGLATQLNEQPPLVPNPLPARIYPWGDLADPEYANFESTEIGATNPVGCFAQGAAPCGAEELSGNVWEWTRSIERTQSAGVAATTGAMEMDLAAHPEVPRILRGGAYQYYEYFVRCAERYSSAPDDWSKLYGFRVALTPES